VTLLLVTFCVGWFVGYCFWWGQLQVAHNDVKLWVAEATYWEWKHRMAQEHHDAFVDRVSRPAPVAFAGLRLVKGGRDA